MNIFERAAQLSSEINDLHALKIRATQAELYEKRANDLSIPVSELFPLNGSVHVLTQLNIPIQLIDRNLVVSLYLRIKDLKSRYEIDRNAIIDPFPGEDVRFVFTQPLSQFPQKINAALRETWSNWAQKNVPSIDNEVLEILTEISALHNSVAGIQRLKMNAESYGASLPSNLDDVNSLTNICNKILEEWHSLTGDGISEGVLKFLREAGNKDGAKFESLNSEVDEWLELHDLKGSLRIRMG